MALSMEEPLCGPRGTQDSSLAVGRDPCPRARHDSAQSLLKQSRLKGGEGAEIGVASDLNALVHHLPIIRS